MADYKQQLESIGFRYDTLTAAGYNKINGIKIHVRKAKIIENCII